MNEPIAYAAIAADGSESVYVASLKEQAEACCRENGWFLFPLYAAPPTWQEECAAVEDAFERSGVKPTWPDDEPGNIGPMAAAMANEIELLRGYRDEAESDAAIAHLLVDKLRLTDDERAAIGVAVQCVGAAMTQKHPEEEDAIALLHKTLCTLRKLLERPL